jgi:hypothetical protein
LGFLVDVQLEKRHRSGTDNSLTVPTKALGFTHGLLCEARKFTHIDYSWREPLVPELLEALGC